MRSDVIIAPVVTEKTNAMRDARKYTFRIDARANKAQVLDAVREAFDVHPVGCNIINVSGKPKRLRYRQVGHRAGWKKAIVTLPAGETIAIFEGA
jgi:large subunit ribosomal protein L23